MIEVTVPCSCPGSPHEQDTVSIPPVLDVTLGAGATYAIHNGPTSLADMEGAIAGAWLHLAPRAWTFVDDKGQPLEITADNIDARLTWAHGGMEVAEKANELYAGDLFAPLVLRRQRDSPSTPTADSTSPTPEPGSDTGSSDKPSLRTVTGGKRSEAKAS